MNKIKRIGIITLSASDNCGSLLQAYALKKYLEKYGSVEIIPFTSNKSKEVYALLRGQGVIKTIIYDRKRVFAIPSMLREKADYTFFRIKKLRIIGRKITSEKLGIKAQDYDYIVAGSDQIWNVAMWDYDNAFMLGWVKNNTKRIAYAPSLGGHFFSESDKADDIKKWIAQFDMISCREDVGREYLESFLNDGANKTYAVDKVLDPTLLLSKSQWESLVGLPMVKGEYVFFYSWAYNNEEICRLVKEREPELSIYVIDARKWVYNSPEEYGFIIYKNGGPSVFLNLMYYAKRCYVESFHGTIFAYIFQKNFWLLDSHEFYEDMDARLKDLVSLLNIRDRVLTIYNSQEFKSEINIDYERRENDSPRLKSVSEAFLDKAFM